MKKIIGIILGIIMVLGVLGLSFFAGMKYANHENGNEQKINEKDSDLAPKEELIKLDDNVVKDADSIIPRTICHGYAIKFDKKNRSVKDISAKEKLAMVIAYFGKDLSFDNVPDDEYDGEVSKEIKKSDIEKLFKDTSFLKALEKEKDQFYGTGLYGMYIENNKYYVNMVATGCLAEEYSDDYIQLIKAEKRDGKLVLTYSYSYLTTKYNEKKDEFTYTLYRNKGDKTPVEKDVSVDEDGEFVVDWSRFHEYEFWFDTSAGNMRLQEIRFRETKNIE